jgi:hypothetical protein
MSTDDNNLRKWFLGIAAVSATTLLGLGWKFSGVTSLVASIVCLAAAAILMIAILWVGEHFASIPQKWKLIIGIAGTFLICIGLGFSIAFVWSARPVEQPKVVPPDLTVRFVYPKEVAISIYNAANTSLADRPKYVVELVDLDNVGADYLRIPVNMGDYLRPGEFWGPNQFMGIDAVKSVVKPGDRIFGSVQVSCPTCVKNRGYWVYIKSGEGGWYFEQDGPTTRIANLDAARKIAADFDNFINTTFPQSERILIK